MYMRTSKLLRNEGFSLIEIIVAIAVLSIAGTMLFNGFTFAARTHQETTKLQMAEDVAQEVAEEFRANKVNWLKTTYGGSLVGNVYENVSETVDATTGVQTLVFGAANPIAWNYKQRSVTGNQDAVFSVKVTLTSKVTANKVGTGNKETGNLVPGSTTDKTTYDQHKAGTNGVFSVNENVGVNTFVIPEVVNIFDGTNTVISEEINQYDYSVAEDLLTAIKNRIDDLNTGKAETSPTYIKNKGDIDADFCAKFIPLNGVSGPNDIKKTTEIEIFDQPDGVEVKYYYIATISYEIKYSANVVYVNNTTASLYDLMQNTSTSGVTGAASIYSIEKTSTDVYKITYKRTFNADDVIAKICPTELIGYEGTFGGKITDESNSLEAILADGSGDPVPYFYILYRPFDIYSDNSGSESNDVIKVKSSLSNNKNVVTTFLVVQDIKHAKQTTLNTTVSDCSVSGNYVGTNDKFRFYTNSREIIAAGVAAPTRNVNQRNYLTNSANKTNVSYYDMIIEVMDKDGNKVAEYYTIKED